MGMAMVIAGMAVVTVKMAVVTVEMVVVTKGMAVVTAGMDVQYHRGDECGSAGRIHYMYCTSTVLYWYCTVLYITVLYITVLILYFILQSSKLEKPVTDTTFFLKLFNKGNIPVAVEKRNKYTVCSSM
jgi:hypothetical protein